MFIVNNRPGAATEAFETHRGEQHKGQGTDGAASAAQVHPLPQLAHESNTGGAGSLILLLLLPVPPPALVALPLQSPLLSRNT